MRKKNIDISTEEKKNEVFNLLNNFNSKTEAYRYFGLSDNAVSSKYLTNIAEQIGFDLNIYKERRKKTIKYCQECGKEITSRDGKLFCSSSCAAKYNNKHRDKSVYEKLAAKLRKEKPIKSQKLQNKNKGIRQKFIKICECCGTEFEVKNKYTKYCSTSCASNFHHLEAYNKYINNQDDYCRPNYTPNAFKSIFLEEQKNKCAICGCLPEHNGKKLVFVLDHIDGDASNNHRDNLRLVCPNCDSQLDTFKSKNKNSTRRNYFREKILKQLYSN